MSNNNIPYDDHDLFSNHRQEDGELYNGGALSNAAAATTDVPLGYPAATSLPSTHYAEGEIIHQQWHGVFIFLAYVAAFIGAYSSIRLLEHGLWRSERERRNASSLITRYPQFFTALILGSCTIWSMHFVGMQAVVLEHVDTMCYNWIETVASVVLSVAGVWTGVRLASRDIFSGTDRVSKLKELLRHDPYVTSKLNRQRASTHIHMVALFYKLHWIAAGSVLAACGALSMHYVGMHAMRGPFRREWSIGLVAASFVVGAVVCFVGFWILFRPLHWKVEKSWYRQAAAGVIALAVCFLHFLGMLSVTYIADSTVEHHCSETEMWGWKSDQIQVLFVGMAVPAIAFLVEHTISNELRITYRQLLDIQLTGSQFLRTNSSSRRSSFSGSTVRISGLGDGSDDSTSRSKRPARATGGRRSLSQRQRDWDQVYNSAEQRGESSCELGRSTRESTTSYAHSFGGENDPSTIPEKESTSSHVENAPDVSNGAQRRQAYKSKTPTTKEESTTDDEESSSRRSRFQNEPQSGDLSLSQDEVEPFPAANVEPATMEASLQSQSDKDEECIEELEQSIRAFEAPHHSLQSFVAACTTSASASASSLPMDVELGEPRHKVATQCA
ncbi:MHYT domain signaling protein [Seminavis robusta]|uniref:MHYT domain signaling protein n=1 Tax=Seminavis robusta TaxID=568900 RepID=A0A9N8DND8_9STRA|nr:MHYT domain signaling protein [Seminavis robusta]|eukprot:Sro257_g100960.1 MHYT domain signaling protein (614) ;mRNA; f:74193-76149